MKKALTFLAGVLLCGSTLQAQTTPPTYVSQNGLVGWWPFTGNANDQSSFANNGTAYGTVLTTDRAGNANSAYAFDGSASYIEVLDAASLRVRKLTMAAWVYSTNPTANHDEIIYKARKSDAYGEVFSMRMGAESSVKIGSGCNAGVGWKIGLFNNQVAPMGVWTHLCSTFDGSYLRNYINSVEVEAIPYSGLIDSCVGSNLRFGYAHDLYGKAWAWPFLGKIDDIGIWNRALNPGEIVEIYKGAPVAAPVTPPSSDTISTNSIRNTTTSRITLSPNPAHNTITLSHSAAGESLQVCITDLMGRTVLLESFAGKEKTFILDGVLQSGLYVVAVRDAQGILVFREKLIVQ